MTTARPPLYSEVLRGAILTLARARLRDDRVTLEDLRYDGRLTIGERTTDGTPVLLDGKLLAFLGVEIVEDVDGQGEITTTFSPTFKAAE